ncbi:MAG: hypothetical protein ABW007_01865 [Chitinophagaceae bacterium]
MSKDIELQFKIPVDYLTVGDKLWFKKHTGRSIDEIGIPRALMIDGEAVLDEHGLPIKTFNPPEEIYYPWLYLCLRRSNPEWTDTFDQFCERNLGEITMLTEKAIYGEELYNQLTSQLSGVEETEETVTTDGKAKS